MSVVVHLVPAAEWPGIEAVEGYRPASLDAGGFVHCSTPERAASVAETLFAGRDDLLAVCLDPDALDARVEYEGPSDGEEFPRVYGPLNAEAVVAVVPFPPDDDGGFSLPDAVRDLD